MSIFYCIRAYRSASSQFVYWNSFEFDGTDSPYPISELSDLVVVFYSYATRESRLLAETGSDLVQENGNAILV